MSVLSPIFRLQFVVTAVLALVFLGEYPSVVKIGGLLLAIAAVWLLQGSAAGAKVEVPREAIARVLLATVAVGIAFFLFKLALRQGATPASVLLCQVVALSSASTALSVYLDRGSRGLACRITLRHPVRRIASNWLRCAHRGAGDRRGEHPGADRAVVVRHHRDSRSHVPQGGGDHTQDGGSRSSGGRSGTTCAGGETALTVDIRRATWRMTST